MDHVAPIAGDRLARCCLIRHRSGDLLVLLRDYNGSRA